MSQISETPSAAETTTVVLDRKAFDLLESLRREGESFSQVVMRCVEPNFSVAEIVQCIRDNPVSDEVLAYVEENIRRRREAAGS